MTTNNNTLISPADGTIVAIEEIEENEFLKGKYRQVSVFMSPLNIHVNRYPCDGIIETAKYYKGKHFVAWSPKSSLQNERTVIVMKQPDGNRIMLRQIAGALARRIVMYAQPAQTVKQNHELGFIRFGSRVDIIVPLEYKIEVQLHQKVKTGITPIASC